MNANEFWINQTRKNKLATPKYSVTTEPDTPEDKLIAAWIEKWQDHFSYFDNTGCGCCVNIYEFDVPKTAVTELPPELVEAYQQANPAPVTGSPSNFSKFFQRTSPKNAR